MIWFIPPESRPEKFPIFSKCLTIGTVFYASRFTEEKCMFTRGCRPILQEELNISNYLDVLERDTVCLIISLVEVHRIRRFF